MAKEKIGSSDRNERGKQMKEVVFPVGDSKLNLPDGYLSFIKEIRQQIIPFMFINWSKLFL